MTYPTQTHEDNNVDEASSLLIVATASPSFSFGHDGVATTKKKNGVSMRAMIATTCFFLGTLAVIYYGRGSSNSSSNSNTDRTDGTSEALLLGHNQAALEVYEPYYDPDNGDYCFFQLYARYDNYCWYPSRIFPVGNWKDVTTDRGYDSCGPVCPAPPPTPSPTPPLTPPPTTPVYDPSQDFCFKDKDNADKYCWCRTDNFPFGNWKGVGGRGYGQCGDLCTHVHPDTTCVVTPTPPPTPSPVSDPNQYDPNTDFCFKDNDNPGKYCWYTHSYFPYGNWDGWDAAYGQCGDKCTKFADGPF